MPPARSPPRGWAEHLRHPSSRTPGQTPTLTPYKEQAHPPSKQGNLLLFLTPPCYSRAPIKPCLNFLSGL